MDIALFLEEEQQWLGNWPEEPEVRWANRQYYSLAKEMLENLRERSMEEGISADAYNQRITKARDVFDNLRGWLNNEEKMTDKQKETFNDQTFWEHKSSYLGGLFDTKQEIWPILKDELASEIRVYLDTPYMQTKSIDYLLTDALIYAEISNYRENLLVKDRYPNLYGTHWKSIFKVALFLLKWGLICLGMIFTHNESKELFLLLGISVIAYQSVKSIKVKPDDEGWELYLTMMKVYNHTELQWFNAGVIWEMCAVARDKGAIFDGVMYELLQRQIAKINK
ncbi:hypothetical protein [Shewanella baltica]|uniref:hypothetical protein n=1 Tax=Shewanella baltica TaxID=62322 RepID=UPI003D7AED59